MENFTIKFLNSLAAEPGKKDKIVFDRACKSLGVRVSANGSKRYIVQWADPITGKKVRDPLGSCDSLPIEDARKAAKARLGAVALGIDPKAERNRKRSEAEAARAEQALTLDTLISDWGSLHLSQRRPRYAAEAQRALRAAFDSHLKRPATKLTRATVVDVLDRLARDGKLTMSARLLSYGRAAYRWAQRRGKLPTNPFENLPVPAPTTQRDRVLDDEEIAAIWSAAGTLGYPFEHYYRFALLVLQRREEVAGAKWSELSSDLTTWSIPGNRMKRGRIHHVHLCEAARDILRSIPRLSGSDYIFTTTGRTSITGFSRSKLQLDAAIAKARAEPGGAPCPLKPWRLHDFRRSGVSALAAMGFDSVVVDKILAHQPGALLGTASIYQRHDFAAERAKALDAWGERVIRGGLPNNVIPLKPATATK